MYYLLYEQDTDNTDVNINPNAVSDNTDNSGGNTPPPPQQDESPNQTLLLLHDYVLKYATINQIEKLKEALSSYVDKYPKVQYIIDIIDDIIPALHMLTTDDVVAVYNDLMKTLSKLGKFIKSGVDNNV
jgi:hypothetical protein